ncbi:hypothetical protein [Devosia sp. FJ2-5-3]|uniref:hypothetical protein n=1 Tax=Devosia sp. FJ2-5-3 TaxID=2976680 RepID=UPI0023D7C7F9|nr:hypothetical protein [Devosia sp. FJ2-5-3]WEJ60243.1 hypothetical protein N0P34_09475 [Devosia sp. FJ2-5-3]
MSNFSDLFRSSQGVATPLNVGGLRTWLYYWAAGVFTAPTDIEVVIHAMGPGGSGGVAMNAGLAGGTEFGMKASGAGAGARAKKRALLKAGEQLIITPGAGGASKVGVSGQRLSGVNGGDTLVTGPNINIVAGGGKGGNAGLITDNVLGGLGGIATGGDLNIPGGRGGDMPAYANTGTAGNLNFATGGGCVDVFGLNDCNGGDIPNYSPFAATSYQYFATGGGSFFGSGGTPASGTSSGATNGGGWGRSKNPFGLDVAGTQRSLPTGFELFGVDAFNAIYGGTTVNGVTSPQVGRGSNAQGVGDGGNASLSGSPGGFFAGGGAFINNGSTGQPNNGGTCYMGGGSSGGVSRKAYTCVSGKGGDGWVALEILS